MRSVTKNGSGQDDVEIVAHYAAEDDPEAVEGLLEIFLSVARIALRQADERGEEAQNAGRDVLRALVERCSK